jgi:hypothetical protein
MTQQIQDAIGQQMGDLMTGPSSTEDFEVIGRI